MILSEDYYFLRGIRIDSDELLRQLMSAMIKLSPQLTT